MSGGTPPGTDSGAGAGAPDLDVAVVGGGPVGLFTAILLIDQGLRVRVFEQRLRRSTHSRAIGIHPPGLRALEASGITEQLVAEGMAIRRGQARFRGSLVGEVGFDSADPRYPFVLTLPQVRTEELLEQRLAALDPQALVRGASVTGLRNGPDRVTLTLAPVAAPGAQPSPASFSAGVGPFDGGVAGGPAGAGRPSVDGVAVHSRTVTARLVAAADGARSPVRGLLGIPRTGERVLDSYLMGDFTDDTGDGPLGVLYLEPEGIVESFPLPGGLRRWVAHTGQLQAEASAGTLAAEIRRRTGIKVNPESNSMLSAFTVRTGRARRMVQGRAVLLGDAAHEVSPIGGQGMTLGWLDAAQAAPLMVRALQGGDVGADLVRFQRRRAREAVIAGAQARLNMALGRPLQPGLMAARNRSLGAVLGAGPAADVLARRFTMQ